MRNFRLRDGGVIREQLLTLSGLRLPVQLLDPREPDGSRELRRHSQAHAGHRRQPTFAEWWAEFDCAPERERELAQNIGQGVFQAAFDSLKNHLKVIRVQRSAVIDAPIERVWAVLRDFNSHGAWHPAVGESRIERDEPSDQVGCVRNFFLQDGNHIREQLLALSDRDYISTYCILDATLPMRNYVATVQQASDRRRQDLLALKSTFDVPKGREREFEQLVGVGVYRPAWALSEYPQGTRVRPRSGSPAAVEAQGVVAQAFGGPEFFNSEPSAKTRRSALTPNGRGRELHRRLYPQGPVPDDRAAGADRHGRRAWWSRAAQPLPRRRSRRLRMHAARAYVTMRALRADHLVLLPDYVGDEAAAAVMLKGMTAEYLLHRTHRVRRAMSCSCCAAAGAWALLPGRRPASWRSRATRPSSRERRRRGHRHALRYKFASRMSRRADVIYDGLGQAAAPENFAALAMRGHWVSYGQASGPLQPLSLAEVRTFSQPVLFHFTATHLQEMAGNVFRALRDGTIGRRCGTLSARGGVRRASRPRSTPHQRPGRTAYLVFEGDSRRAAGSRRKSAPCAQAPAARDLGHGAAVAALELCAPRRSGRAWNGHRRHSLEVAEVPQRAARHARDSDQVAERSAGASRLAWM